jgi:hypothetical protein
MTEEFLQIKNKLDSWTTEEKHKFLREYIEITRQNIKFLHYILGIKTLNFVTITLNYKEVKNE